MITSPLLSDVMRINSSRPFNPQRLIVASMVLLCLLIASSHQVFSLPDRICYPLNGGTPCINATTITGLNVSSSDPDRVLNTTFNANPFSWLNYTNISFYNFLNSSNLTDYSDRVLNTTFNANPFSWLNYTNVSFWSFLNWSNITNPDLRLLNSTFISNPYSWINYTNLSSYVNQTYANSTYLTNRSGALLTNLTINDSGAISFSEGSGVQTMWQMNQTGDGFKMEYWYDFDGAFDDRLVFRKTDGNDAFPDGGFAIVMSNSSGANVTVLKIDGDGTFNFTNDNLITLGNISSSNIYNSTTSNDTYYLKSNPYNYLNYSNITDPSLRVLNSTFEGLNTTTYSLITNVSELNRSHYSLLSNFSALNTTVYSNNISILLYLTSIGNWTSDKPNYVNQTYANTTYYLKSNPLNFVNSSNLSGSDASTRVLNETFDSLVVNFTALNTTVYSLITNVTEINRSHYSLLTNFTALNTTAYSNNVSILAYLTSIGNWTADNSLKTNVTTLNTTVYSLITNVTEINRSHYSLLTNFTTLNTTAYSNNASILLYLISIGNWTKDSSLMTNFTTLNTTVYSLRTNVTEVNRTAYSLITNVTEINRSHYSLLTNFTALNTTAYANNVSIQAYLTSIGNYSLGIKSYTPTTGSVLLNGTQEMASLNITTALNFTTNKTGSINSNSTCSLILTGATVKWCIQ